MKVLTALELEEHRRAGHPASRAHDWGTDEKGRDNHARVAAVHAALTAAGMRCWFDEEQMQGDINARMTEGVDTSAVVVVFITKRYCAKVAGKGKPVHLTTCISEVRESAWPCGDAQLSDEAGGDQRSFWEYVDRLAGAEEKGSRRRYTLLGRVRSRRTSS